MRARRLRLATAGAVVGLLTLLGVPAPQVGALSLSLGTQRVIVCNYGGGVSPRALITQLGGSVVTDLPVVFARAERNYRRILKRVRTLAPGVPIKIELLHGPGDIQAGEGVFIKLPRHWSLHSFLKKLS